MSEAPAALVRIRGGVSVSVPDDLAEMATYILREQEDWFEEELQFVRTVLAPGDLVVDVGANYGVYALSAARLVGPAGRVLAFEPGAGPAAHLRRSKQANGFDGLEIVAAALSDRSGQGHLSGGRDAALAEVVAEGGAEAQAITLLTLDEADARWDLGQAAFLKLDAEGHEPRIVAGGEKFLERASPLVLLEIRVGEKIDLSLIERLGAWGFQAFRLLPGLGQLLALEPGEALDGYALNLFLAKPDRQVILARRGLLGSAPRGLSVESNDWRAALAGFPLVRALALGWQSQGPGAAAYETALGAWAAAHAPGTSPSDRVSLLAQARTAGETALNAQPTLARAVTLSRLCAEIGQRTVTLKVLGAALEATISGAPFPDEPFLPPSPPLEARAPGAAPLALLLAMILERFEKLRAHSSLFVGAEALPRLEKLHDLGFGPPEMERRLQLVRMRAGQQGGPQASPLLADEGPGNLNPGFWNPVR